MAQIGKTFRIFVSSTFSDLKEERNALQRQVFPELRKLCMQYGCRFQAIDLRWGVSEEAGLDQQTMKICLEEIARCQKTTPRPNFIVLLGDRYGWCPLPYEIPADEFERVLSHVVDASERELLTQWYKRDVNAVSPVYCLQPRTGEFVDSGKWMPVERHLRSVLLEVIKELPLESGERLKYTASATEQEIVQGVMRIKDASEHIFCFCRSILIPQDDGSTRPIKDAPLDQSFYYFADLDHEGRLDQKAHARLDDLKKRLSQLLGGNLYQYKLEWNGSVAKTEYLNRLCEDVWDSLSRVITEQAAALERADAVEQEIMAHEEFGRERARFFTGRASILQSIGDYLRGTDIQPVAIFGESGSGKTALMARAVQMAQQTLPNAEVVFRFIGATPSSSDGRSLLESLCRQISRGYGADESTIPTDYRELVQEFPNRLALVTKEKPLILFLDALDQLSDIDNARNLSWLLPNLPEHVCLVVSSLPGECLSALKNKLPVEDLVELGPMPLDEGQELLNLWLKDASRTLQPNQRDEVLGKFTRCRLPLYLKLAFEEARRWKSYTEKTELNQDIPGIIRDLFRRLSAEANHGEMLVSRSLGYLATAKNGLTEDELLDVLSGDEEVFQDFMKRARHELPEKKLPVVIWSRLYFDLEPYLTERTVDGTSLMTFYHRQLGEVVAEEFLAGEAKRKRHEKLATYFGQAPIERKLDEYPYQLQHAEQWPALAAALSDLDFFDFAWEREREYEWMGYWRSLEGRFEPGPCYQAAIEAREKAEGETVDVALLLGKIGLFLSDMGLYPSALPFYQRALAIDERNLGPDHSDVASSLSNLAGLYLKQGKYDEALPLLKRALAIREGTLGPDHPDFASSLNHLAALYKEQGKHDEALSLFKRALAIREGTLGPDHPDVAVSLNNLALVYREQGKYDEALPFYQRALAINEGTLGPDHPDVANSLSNLAGLYTNQGKYNEALSLYQRALAINERTFGPNHPEVANNLNSLAALYEEQGKYDGALPLLKRALAIRERTLGREHPYVAVSLNNLAAVYGEQGRYDEALPLYQRVLAIIERDLGPDHSYIATALNNLAVLYLKQGKYDEALPLLKRLLAIDERTFGPDHPDFAKSLSNLAVLYFHQGNYAEALPLLKRTVSIVEAALGPEHPNTKLYEQNLKICQDAMR